MNRIAFLLRYRAGMKDQFSARLCANESAVRGFLTSQGLSNASVWTVDQYVFCYAERRDPSPLAVDTKLEELFRDTAEYIARPGEMRLMYSDIGVVHEDKSEIRHRVFATLIHEGCAEEYKARHDALAKGREGRPVRDHSDSNFTIWCACGKYNFGYCEKVRAFDHEMTEREIEGTKAWENRMLEIMDWLTDDVDWITGEKHPAMECLFRQ